MRWCPLPASFAAAPCGGGPRTCRAGPGLPQLAAATATAALIPGTPKAPYLLTWTPNATTPDLLYYQARGWGHAGESSACSRLARTAARVPTWQQAASARTPPGRAVPLSRRQPAHPPAPLPSPPAATSTAVRHSHEAGLAGAGGWAGRLSAHERARQAERLNRLGTGRHARAFACLLKHILWQSVKESAIFVCTQRRVTPGPAEGGQAHAP